MLEVIVPDDEKEKYFKAHYPFDNPPEMTDQKKCLHCDGEFQVGQYRVFRSLKGDDKGMDYITCPYCSATILDWWDIYDGTACEDAI